MARSDETGRIWKIQRPPPLSDVTKTPLDNVMFLLAKLNLKVVLPPSQFWEFF